jgi:hypothetical protein
MAHLLRSVSKYTIVISAKDALICGKKIWSKLITALLLYSETALSLNTVYKPPYLKDK